MASIWSTTDLVHAFASAADADAIFDPSETTANGDQANDTAFHNDVLAALDRFAEQTPLTFTEADRFAAADIKMVRGAGLDGLLGSAGGDGTELLSANEIARFSNGDVDLTTGTTIADALGDGFAVDRVGLGSDDRLLA